MATKKTSDIVRGKQRTEIGLHIVGTAPLLMNAFPQKAVEQMLRKHMGMPNPREKKNPGEIIDRATPRNTAGAISLTPTALKKAMITAAATSVTFKRATIQTAVYIVGGSVPIAYGVFKPQMDFVRNSGIGRAPDVRFRPCFDDWSCNIIIRYSEDVFDVAAVTDLVDRAGDCGVGEWRPSKGGTHGTFSVERAIQPNSQEWKDTLKACQPQMPSLVIPEWALLADVSPELLRKIASSEHMAAQGGSNGVGYEQGEAEDESDTSEAEAFS